MKTLFLFSLLCSLAHCQVKQEIQSHIFSFAATIGDIETSHLAFQYHQCHELNPLSFSRYPSRTQMYATNIPIAVAASILTHKWRKGGKKFWAIPNLLNGGLHTGGILINQFSNCY